MKTSIANSIGTNSIGLLITSALVIVICVVGIIILDKNSPTSDSTQAPTTVQSANDIADLLEKTAIQMEDSPIPEAGPTRIILYTAIGALKAEDGTIEELAILVRFFAQKKLDEVYDDKDKVPNGLKPHLARTPSGKINF